jgi:ribosomal protein L15
VCEPHIEPEVKQSKKAFVGKMSFVNIDTLDQYFNDGDTVSLEKLKAMGLIPANVKQMTVLARYTGEFSKVLTVETQGISAEARVAIVKAGGKVIITDGGTDTAENKGKQ